MPPGWSDSVSNPFCPLVNRFEYTVRLYASCIPTLYAGRVGIYPSIYLSIYLYIYSWPLCGKVTSFIEVKVPNVRSQCRQSRTETRIAIGITCVKSVKIGRVVIGTARSVCATARRPSANPLLQLQVCCCVRARRAGWRSRPE